MTASPNGPHSGGDWRLTCTAWECRARFIQAILRHSNVAVTQACYIKIAGQDSVRAKPWFYAQLVLWISPLPLR